MYLGVVSIEHVRLILLMVDLNNLEEMVADIGDIYLHGKTREDLYTKIDIGGKNFRVGLCFLNWGSICGTK